jgi:hypothetical protein
MALNRTWYNSLVDDDGSGLTGSVWDKADVDALMDAVDAEIARVDGILTTGAYATGNWTPAILGSSGQSGQTYGARAGTWVQNGKLFVCWFNLTLAAKGTAAGQILIGGLPYPSAADVVVPLTPLYFQNAAYALAGLYGVMNPGATGITLYTLPPAGGTGMSAIDATYLTNTLQLGGTIVYRAA